MESTYRQEHLSRWFLPALLLHFIIICAFLMLEQEHQSHAEVVFLDEQEHIQPPQPLSTIVQAQPDDQEVLFSINLPQSSTFGATELESELPHLADNTVASPTEKSEQTESQTQESPQEQTNKPSIQEESFVQEEITTTPNASLPIDAPGPSSLLQQQPEQKSVQKKPTTQKKQSSSPIKKTMSLQKLAEGFLNYSKENTSIDINSKDLSLEPTLQKIGWFLQNSFHLHNKPIALNQDVRTSITLHLEIDAQGNLLNSRLSPQTNIPALDKNLLRIAQGAAPFPPIPQHVMRSRKTFCIKIPIEIDARRGTHEYYFIFRG